MLEPWPVVMKPRSIVLSSSIRAVYWTIWCRFISRVLPIENLGKVTEVSILYYTRQCFQVNVHICTYYWSDFSNILILFLWFTAWFILNWFSRYYDNDAVDCCANYPSIFTVASFLTVASFFTVVSVFTVASSFMVAVNPLATGCIGFPVTFNKCSFIARIYIVPLQGGGVPNPSTTK